jgi:dTDP-4-amino-4,6-dideoxygalactose transaminase
MPNINAALGLAQLEQLPQFLESKRQIAHAYNEFFKTLNGLNHSKLSQPSTIQQINDSTIQHINEPINSTSNYWLNCLLLPNRQQRDEFLKYTNENGIMTRPAWELMNRLPMFKNAQCGNLSNAEWIADRLANISSSVTI